MIDTLKNITNAITISSNNEWEYMNKNNTVTTTDGSSLIIGDINPTEQEIYIVEKWQTKSPIIIDDDLTISLKKDILSKDELHKKIMDKINSDYPEVALKIGANKLRVRKLSIPIEIKDEQ